MDLNFDNPNPNPPLQNQQRDTTLKAKTIPNKRNKVTYLHCSLTQGFQTEKQHS